MKRVTIVFMLAVLFAVQFACNYPIDRSADVTPTPVGAPTQTPMPEPTFTALPAAETPSTGTIDLDLLKNFTYWVEDFNIQAALKDGVFSDGQIQVTFIEPAATGDLNGDGQEDAAVILAIKSGGTGTFYDLITLLDQNGTPVQAGFSYIGDRQIVKNLEIASGRVVLDYITQGLSDPLCCPSEHRLRSYLLENGALLLVSEQILDSPTAQATPLPDAIIIDQPVMVEPFTTPLEVRGRVSQVPPEKSLAYYVTDLSATLLMEGDVPLEGEPGGPGSFAFEINVEVDSPGLIQVELVDSANGILRGRSIVVLVAEPPILNPP